MIKNYKLNFLLLLLTCGMAHSSIFSSQESVSEEYKKGFEMGLTMRNCHDVEQRRLELDNFNKERTQFFDIAHTAQNELSKQIMADYTRENALRQAQITIKSLENKISAQQILIELHSSSSNLSTNLPAKQKNSCKSNNHNLLKNLAPVVIILIGTKIYTSHYKQPMPQYWKQKACLLASAIVTCDYIL